MNPQCGYYQNQNGQQNNYMKYQQTYGTYGGNGGAAPRPNTGASGYGSSTRMQPTRTRSTYGYTSNQNQGRAPPVFGSPSSGNLFNSSGYQQQQSSWGGSSARPRQNVGRSIPAQPQASNNSYPMYYQQQQTQPQPHSLAPAQCCTPQAIKVNVTAEQLQNAQNTPYQDRGEASLEGAEGVKYIQLNWQDLLGGMENMRVSMVPSADPCNPNRQLKVSFGGQKTDPPQAGETSLKVVSIEPATTNRMDIRDGNAYAGAMKTCSPPAHLRMRPSAATPQNGGNCRR